MATQYFSYQITDTNPVQVNVGNHALNFEWRWPVVPQEQYDLLLLRIKDMMLSDPIVGSDQINRDYDYLDYYLSVVPQDASELVDWVSQQEALPVSVKDLSPNTAANVITQRIEFCQELSEYKLELEEQLHWQGVITDENNEKTVVDVRTGGWFRNQDNSYALNFQADVPAIGQNQLPLVTIHFEVYDAT